MTLINSRPMSGMGGMQTRAGGSVTLPNRAGGSMTMLQGQTRPGQGQFQCINPGNVSLRGFSAFECAWRPACAARRFLSREIALPFLLLGWQALTKDLLRHPCKRPCAVHTLVHVTLQTCLAAFR